MSVVLSIIPMERLKVEREALTKEIHALWAVHMHRSTANAFSGTSNNG